MELQEALTQGNARALDMVRSIASLPALISVIPPFYIPIEVDSYSKDSQAEVATQPVIVPGKEQKQLITDNVAPGAWTWNLSGYIPGNSFEFTNLFTPFAIINRKMIEKAYEEGRQLTFKDRDCTLKTNVVIESISIGMNAECLNKTPVTLTLRQINTTDIGLADLSAVEAAAVPEAGSIAGASADMGSSITTDVTSNFKTLVQGIQSN